MHHPSRQARPYRQQAPGSERVFEDALSRLWSAGLATASQSVDAVLFTCISEPREAHRAVGVSMEFDLLGATPDDLRTLLTVAPRVGLL